MHKLAIDQLAPSNVIHHMFELPSMSKMVRYLHAALGFPKKATLLTAAKHGNLTTFPGLTVENITKYFPESDKTQKGHMKQQKQGVRCTKVPGEDKLLHLQPTLE